MPCTMKKSIAAAVSVLSIIVRGSEPNPPNWNSTFVKVLDPEDDCQKVVDEIYAEMGGEDKTIAKDGVCHRGGQFSHSRYAVLFKQGFHNCLVKIGFYTTVHGLGRDPTDTKIAQIESADMCGNALDNFWRGVENFSTGYNGTVEWHVSQAAPMRRMHINGSIRLGEGWSSGGYMSNSLVEDTVDAGSQQQWFNRNNQQADWKYGSWSFVHLGCVGAPETVCYKENQNSGNINIQSTPVIAEKPYIVQDDSGNYTLVVPGYEVKKQGYNWHGPEREVSFDQVYVASESDTAAKINDKLTHEVDHVILQPGNYYFDEPIRLKKHGQVVLGIGMPTINSLKGNSCVEVSNVKDVRVAGMILQPASNNPGPHLLRWGTKTWWGGHFGDEDSPGVINDVFGRVGGEYDSREKEVQINQMMQINSNYIIIDHTWLWRADHDIGGSVMYSRNYVANGLEVNGQHVKAYGLFVEHTLENMLVWNGDDGQVYMYQSELPYDVDQYNYANRDFHSYHVNKKVKRHISYGAGVYSFFRDHRVYMDTAIKTPWRSEIRFFNPFSKMLNGMGGFDHVFNDQGDPAYHWGISVLCGERVAIPTKLSSLLKFGAAAARLH